MAHQLMCGNSLSTTLPMILAIVHVLDVTPQLVYVHPTANLLSGQIGPPGKYSWIFIHQREGLPRLGPSTLKNVTLSLVGETDTSQSVL